MKSRSYSYTITAQLIFKQIGVNPFWPSATKKFEKPDKQVAKAQAHGVL